MLHVWLLPAVMVLVLGLCAFYLVVKRNGGTGVRTQGKTVLDQPAEEHDLPPE